MCKSYLKLFFSLSLQTFFIIPMATTPPDVVASSDARDLASIDLFYRALDAANLPTIKNLLLSDPWLVNLQKEYPQKESPLHRVARMNNSAVMKLLISHGAHISKDNDGDTPLHVAVRNNAYQLYNQVDSCVLQLVRLAIGQIHVANNKGDQPLHIACRNEFWFIVQWLVQLGAQKDVRNEMGETPESIIRGLNSVWKKALERVLAFKRIQGI